MPMGNFQMVYCPDDYYCSEPMLNFVAVPSYMFSLLKYFFFWYLQFSSINT